MSENVLKMLHTVYEENDDILCFVGDEEVTKIKDEALLTELTTGMKPIFDKLVEDSKKLGVDLEVKLIIKLV